MELDEAMEYFHRGIVQLSGGEKSERFGTFSKIYIFSNERLDIILKRLDLKGKKILTTGSSGDQALYLLLYGASEVKVFDICPFAKYYYDLKCSILRNFSFNGFNSLMNEKYGMFNPSVYRRVSHDLPYDSRTFWDNAYLEGFNNTDFEIARELDKWVYKCEYLNDPILYKKMQGVARKNNKVQFLNCDLRDLPEVLDDTEKFDFILLSNIIKYTKYWNPNKIEAKKEYYKVLHKLEQQLNIGGIIQIDYRYSDVLKQLLKYKVYLGDKKVVTSTISPTEGAIFYKPNIEEENE